MADETVTQTQDEMDFDAAFEEATSEQPNADAAGSGPAPEPTGDAAEDEGSPQGQGTEEPAQEAKPEGDGQVKPRATPADETDLSQIDQWDREKLASAYKSLHGRVPTLQRENARLQRELREAQAKQAQPAQREERRAKEAEIPASLADDMNEFSKEYPAFADLAREASPEGERVRKALEFEGPSQAARDAQIIQINRRMESENAARAEEAQRRYYDAIFSAHPDVGDVFRSGDQTAIDTWRGQLMDWVSTLSYHYGRYVIDVLNLEGERGKGGKPEEVVDVLNKFKERDRQSAQKQPAQAAAKPKNLAVPGRHAPAPTSKPDPNDYDKAWEEAARA